MNTVDIIFLFKTSCFSFIGVFSIKGLDRNLTYNKNFVKCSKLYIFNKTYKGEERINKNKENITVKTTTFIDRRKTSLTLADKTVT